MKPRARPSRYFEGADYEKVFGANLDLKIFVSCALLRKSTEQFLIKAKLPKKDQNNMLFYILMVLGRMIQNKEFGNDVTLVSLEPADISSDALKRALSIVQQIYLECGGDDTAAKGKEMLAALKDALKGKKRKKKVAKNSVQLLPTMTDRDKPNES
jgi:hypothetical protein